MMMHILHKNDKMLRMQLGTYKQTQNTQFRSICLQGKIEILRVYQDSAEFLLFFHFQSITALMLHLAQARI